MEGAWEEYFFGFTFQNRKLITIFLLICVSVPIPFLRHFVFFLFFFLLDLYLYLFLQNVVKSLLIRHVLKVAVARFAEEEVLGKQEKRAHNYLLKLLESLAKG